MLFIPSRALIRGCEPDSDLVCCHNGHRHRVRSASRPLRSIPQISRLAESAEHCVLSSQCHFVHDNHHSFYSSLHAVPGDMDFDDPSSGSITLPRNPAHGFCDHHQYVRGRLRACLEWRKSIHRLGYVVDRCCYQHCLLSLAAVPNVR